MIQLNKSWFPLWWTLTGVAWFCLGYILISMCVGIIVILCGWLNDSKNKVVAIIANVVLALYTLAFTFCAFMLIAVGSPKSWLAMIILLVTIINVILCIKNGYKLITE